MALADYTKNVDFTSGLLHRALELDSDEIFVSIDIPEEDIPEKGILVFTSKAGTAYIRECNQGCLPSKTHTNVIKNCRCEIRRNSNYSSKCRKQQIRPVKVCEDILRDCCSEDSEIFEMVAYDSFHKCDNCDNLYVFCDLTRGLPYNDCQIATVAENIKTHSVGEQVVLAPVTHFNFCDGQLPKSACDTVRGCITPTGLLDSTHLLDRGWIGLPPGNVWKSISDAGGVLRFNQDSGTIELTPADIANGLPTDDGVTKRNGVVVGNYTAGDFIELTHITAGERKGEVVISSTDDARYGIQSIDRTYETKAVLNDIEISNSFKPLPSLISQLDFRVEKPFFLNNPGLLASKPYTVFYDATLTLVLEFKEDKTNSNRVVLQFCLMVDGQPYDGGVFTQTAILTPTIDQNIDYVHVHLKTRAVRQTMRLAQMVKFYDVQPHQLQLGYRMVENDDNLIASTENSLANIIYV